MARPNTYTEEEKTANKQARKVAVFNPNNEEDSKILEFLQDKSFSTYARELIVRDMNCRVELDANSLLKILFSMSGVSLDLSNLPQSNAADKEAAIALLKNQVVEEGEKPKLTAQTASALSALRKKKV